MKALEKSEKENIKLQFAVGLHKALKESSFKSYRQLAKEAGMEPAHMQKIATGKLDVTLTTNFSIALALGISYAELAKYFDNVTKSDREEFNRYIERQQLLRGKPKIKLKKS